MHRAHTSRSIVASLLVAACTATGGGGNSLVDPKTNTAFSGQVIHCVDESCAGKASSTCFDCTAKKLSIGCVDTVCRQSCQQTTDCPDGRVCEALPSGDGTTVCIPDCTDGSACPAGLTCTPTWIQGQMRCVLPSETYAACVGVKASLWCDGPVPTGFCGGKQAACPGLSCTCPSNSTCTGSACDTATCACNDGFVTACCDDGKQCDSTYPCNDCGGTNARKYGCAPNPQPGCNDDLTNMKGTCICVDGRKPPYACGTKGTCESRCQSAK